MMLNKPLEGRKKCTKCGHIYDWHYYLRVQFYDEPNSEQKLYDRKDGSMYGYFDPQYNAARNPDSSILNCEKPDPVYSNYVQPFFWGFNVVVKCDECGNKDTAFVDLREELV